MAETLISPGVLSSENDQSFVTLRPQDRGAAIIGPTVLGPVEKPTLVGSFSAYQAIFGGALESGSNEYTYLTSIAANNYFQNGGTSLLVTRVVSGSFTSATSSFVNSVDGEPLLIGADAVLFANGVFAGSNFTGSVDGGTSYRITSAVFTTNGSGTGGVINLDIDTGVPNGVGVTTAGTGYEVGDTLTFSTNDNYGSPLISTSILNAVTINTFNTNTDPSTTFDGTYRFQSGSTAATDLIVSNGGTATGVELEVTILNGAITNVVPYVAGSGEGEGSIVGTTFEISEDAINAQTGDANGTGKLTLVITEAELSAGTFTITLEAENLESSLSSLELETISEGEVMNTGTSELSNGALASGSAQNLRWEITSANTSSGVFSLAVRRGDDTNNNKIILETFNNISLDPFAPNYISKAIGDISTQLVTEGVDTFLQESGSFPQISNYVRVKSVRKTPYYFNNDGSAKDQFTGSLPSVSSGSFGGAVGSNTPADRAANFYQNINDSDTQGLKGFDYNDAISLLSNKENYQYNIISVPGLSVQYQNAQVTSIINNSISRGDNIAVVDLVGYNQSINTVINKASGIDNSYASTYWPWLQTIDPNSGQLVFIPASTFIPGAYVFTDKSAGSWFAPAGKIRGKMGQVVRAERKLSSTNKDTLYEANVNPITTMPNKDVIIYGQKTLQKAASALDRVNVRRLLIILKDYISQISDTLVFEQNTISTRNNFLTQVNPYLENIKQKQGLYDFKVIMDETNNTPDVIDRNELVGQIFLKPTKTIEFVILDFNILPTGAIFP